MPLIPSAPVTSVTKPRRQGRFLPALLLILMLSVLALLKLRYVWPRQSTRSIAPGVSLTTTEYNRFAGGVKTYVVRASRKNWRLRIVPASENMLTREATTAIVAASSAPVAVNGGYFAYDGGPVGPLRVQGEWLRLPWKNRTTLGLKADGTVKIAPLAALATVEFPEGLNLPVQNLNGKPAPGTLAVLTSHFPVYKLRQGENALLIEAPQNGKRSVPRVITSGTITMAHRALALVGSSTAMRSLNGLLKNKPAGLNPIRLQVTLTPLEWEQYPDILGAGPLLVRDGAIKTTEREGEFKPDVLKRGPRTALGVASNGDFILLVADGRQFPFEGLTIPQLAEDIKSAGAVDALSLDGGNSATLVVNGQVVNNPSAGGEVLVANAVTLEKLRP